MSKNCQESFRFQVLPSRRLQQLTEVLHGCAILACWLNGLQILYQLLLMVIVVLLWWHYAMRREARPAYLRYTENKRWEVSMDQFTYQPAVILDTTVITSAVIFLHYKTDDQSSGTLVIAGDSLSANDFRRLRVRLAIYGRDEAR